MIRPGKQTLQKKLSTEPAKRGLRNSPLPVDGTDSSSVPSEKEIAFSNKRKPGRPKKTEFRKDQLNPKAHIVLQKIADDQLALSNPTFDGGGTQENSPTITKESLERRIARRLNVLDRFLTDERLQALLQESSLREIGIYEGIMMDKSLILKGQPNVIIGNADRIQIDNVLPRLLDELHRRKLTTTASERKIEFVSTPEFPSE